MMVRSARWFGAALIASALVSSAGAETTPAPQTQTPTLHARAKQHVRKHHVEKPEGRQVTVHKGGNTTPSWLTLGTDAAVGAGNNYVTGAFDQPSAVEGTFSGYRGRERLINRYGAPGATLFQF